MLSGTPLLFVACPRPKSASETERSGRSGLKVLSSGRMLRAALWIVLLCGVTLVAAPMVLASLYVDQHGVELTAHIYSKSEYLRLNQGS